MKKTRKEGSTRSRPFHETLTRREREVLSLVTQGKSNKKVAAQLIINVRTVENHLHSIYEKLYVHSRTEAAIWAIKSGIVMPNTGDTPND